LIKKALRVTRLVDFERVADFFPVFSRSAGKFERSGGHEMGLVLCVAAILLAAVPGAAAAADAEAIAQVKSVTGQVAISRSGRRLSAKIGDPLFEKDVVETGADGGIGITFVDNTVFSTGPNSRLALDEFRFDSNNFQGSMLADMRQGTLAVVSGDITRSSPGAMKIKTPTAVLGVRGTRFAVQVYGDH
jgi:hypothetical protein